MEVCPRESKDKMQDARWMIYGATGYTGQLVLAEALLRGHAPIVAGRNEEKVRPLARAFGLKHAVFNLDDINTIAQHIADCELVYHAAGPFTHTSEPMLRACLATRTHYLDITGEIDVFERVFAYDDVARKNGVALLSGVGFDVIPSDCLAAYVAAQVPTATHLEIGLQALSQVSAGTAKSMLEMLPQGARVRRDGVLVAQPFGVGARKINLTNGTHHAVPIPWGDVATAYRTTGIPNITAYMAFPRVAIAALRASSPLLRLLGRSVAMKRGLGWLLDRMLWGASEALRETGRSYLWARAWDKHGSSAQAWLETAEGYAFTAKAAVPVIERVLDNAPIGALTPAQAWGADFVLTIEGTRRMDTLAVA